MSLEYNAACTVLDACKDIAGSATYVLVCMYVAI